MGFEIWTAEGIYWGIFPPKIFKIEVLRNGISGILRPSQHVTYYTISHFFLI